MSKFMLKRTTKTNALTIIRASRFLSEINLSGFSVNPELPNALLKYQAKIDMKKGIHKINSNLYLAAKSAKLLDEKIA